MKKFFIAASCAVMTFSSVAPVFSGSQNNDSEVIYQQTIAGKTYKLVKKGNLARFNIGGDVKCDYDIAVAMLAMQDCMEAEAGATIAEEAYNKLK